MLRDNWSHYMKMYTLHIGHFSTKSLSKPDSRVIKADKPIQGSTIIDLYFSSNRTFVREHDNLIGLAVEVFRRSFRLGRFSGSKFEHIAYQGLGQGRERHRDVGRFWQSQLLQDLLLHVFHSELGQERVVIDQSNLILRAFDALVRFARR